jgi:uncharacterized protein YuzE
MKRKKIRLEYDAQVDAAYLTLRSGRIAESEEVQPGVIVDFDTDDQILGVEILRFAGQFRRRREMRAPLAKSR